MSSASAAPLIVCCAHGDSLHKKTPVHLWVPSDPGSISATTHTPARLFLSLVYSGARKATVAVDVKELRGSLAARGQFHVCARPRSRRDLWLAGGVTLLAQSRLLRGVTPHGGMAHNTPQEEEEGF